MTIRKLVRYVFVGNDEDFKSLKTSPAILHAAKEPWHRNAVGYITRGAPKESPEYLYAVRDFYSVMSLNLIDVDDVKYVNKDLIDAAINFVNYHRCKSRNVFIHCNQGRSRGPTIGMLAIAPLLDEDYAIARASFEVLYPEYQPKLGMELYAQQNWSYYHANSEDHGGHPNFGPNSGIYWPPGEGRTLLGHSDESVESLNGDSLDTISGGTGEVEQGSEHRGEIAGSSSSSDPANGW